MPRAIKPRFRFIWDYTNHFYIVATVLFLIYATLRLSSLIRNEETHHLSEIRIVHPWIASGVAWSAFVAAIALLLLSFCSFFEPLLQHPTVGMLLAVLLYPLCFLCHACINLGPWTLYGEVTTTDKTRYVFCDSSFLQGQTMVIAKATKINVFSGNYEVLVETNGDWPRSWASVIRPANSPDIYGQLYLSPENVLVGVRYSNHCYLAYDLDRRVAIAHDDIEHISPFILLNAKTPLNALDIDRTLESIQEQANYCKKDGDIRHTINFLNGEPVSGCPLIAPLQAGLEHPNSEVRSAAQLILTRYTTTKATLASRIRISDDK